MKTLGHAPPIFFYFLQEETPAKLLWEVLQRQETLRCSADTRPTWVELEAAE